MYDAQEKIIAAAVTTVEQLAEALKAAHHATGDAQSSVAAGLNACGGVTLFLCHLEEQFGLDAEEVQSKLEQVVNEKYPNFKEYFRNRDDNDDPPCGYDPSRFNFGRGNLN